MFKSTSEFLAWNAETEKQTAWLFDSPHCPLVPNLLNPLASSRAPTLFSEAVVILTPEIDRLQVDLDQLVQVRPEVNSIERKWTSLTSEKKTAMLWKALEKVSEIVDMRDRRIYAEEVRVEKLMRADGKAFLELVEKVAVQGSVGRKKFQLIMNVRFEEIMDQTANLSKTARNFLNIGRTYFISQFVYEVILLLDGKTYKTIFLKTGPSLRKQKEDALSGSINDLNVSKKDRETIYKDLKAFRSVAISVCENCGTFESDLDSGKKLMVCKVCKESGKDVRYCSRECQLTDWKKNGHKSVCGKPELGSPIVPPYLSTSSKTNSTRPDVKPPSDGYIRSPALLAQIKALEEDPLADYVLFLPSPATCDVSATFMNPKGANIFRRFRDMAMDNGEPTAVAMSMNLKL